MHYKATYSETSNERVWTQESIRQELVKRIPLGNHRSSGSKTYGCMHRRSSRAWCNRDIVTEDHVVLPAVSYELCKTEIQDKNPNLNQRNEGESLYSKETHQEESPKTPENYEEQYQNCELLWPPSAPRSQSEKEPGGQIPIPDQNRQVRPDRSQ